MHFELSRADLEGALGEEFSVEGTGPEVLRGIAGLEEAGPEDLTFLSHARYARKLAATKGRVVLVPTEFAASPQAGQRFYRLGNPSLALARVCAYVEARILRRPAPGIHPSAVIDRDARISPEASVGPLCTVGADAVIGGGTTLVSHVAVGRGAEIGADSWLAPHVVIGDFCRVGQRCRLHPGVVLGADGFGYMPHEGRLLKVPQIGIVVVEDEVEIGANTTIDRARFAETRIGAGSKLDNLVQIAHNVKVGRSSAIAAQAGLSGSVEIGSGVLVYGQAGFAGHLKVGDGAIVAAQAGVSKDVAPGTTVQGTPAMEFMPHQRVLALQRNLPSLVKRIEKLEEMLNTQGNSNESLA